MSQDTPVAAARDLVMPRLSDSMEEGKILTWLKPSGETVAPGDELAEIETDKATVVYEAEDQGVLEIVVAEGATAAIGEVIARLHPDGLPSGVSAPPAAPEVSSGGAAALPEPGVAQPGPAIEMSSTQALIARRMVESHTVVPDFSLEVDIDMTAAVAVRKRLAQTLDPAPSLNDMIVKACAIALAEFPLANASFTEAGFDLHPSVNIGVAVATEESLVVPTVFDADQRSLAEIAATTRELAGKVRSGTVTPAELSGATFTVSNLGMYGIRSFTAIINRPQAAILAAGAAQQRATVRGGGVEVRDVMAATLGCDHRILYGAYAAKFLARIREVLEQAEVTLQ